jgi:hypothetical protein
MAAPKTVCLMVVNYYKGSRLGELTMSTVTRWGFVFIILSGFILNQIGCTKATGVSKVSPAQNTKAGHDEDHPEKGPHGGILVEWGEEEYHVEVTINHPAKQAIIYLLDSTAKHAAKADPAKVTDLILTLSSSPSPLSIPLKYDASKSNDKGIAFVGNHKGLSKDVPLAGKVTGSVDKENFSGKFNESDQDHKPKKERD